MTIMVDDLFEYSPGQLWCHMASDTSEEELHQFAEKIGMKKSWFQLGGMSRTFPHYDLKPGMRARAIRGGAESVTRQDLVSRSIRRKPTERRMR